MKFRFRLPLITICLWVLACFSTQAASTTEPPRILYLGDSLSMGAFGKHLDGEIRKAGGDLHTVVAGGASPYYWLKAYQELPCTIGYWEKTSSSERNLGYIRAVPKLEDLLDTHTPDVVVIQTGINLYATLRSRRSPREKNVMEVRSLIDQMSHSIAKAGAKAYWILPPHSHERRYSRELQAALAEIMKGLVKEYNGAIFDSSRVTRFTDPYPATDGIHYGPTEALQWAEKVSSDFGVFMKISPAYKASRTTRTIPFDATSSTSTSAALLVKKEEPQETTSTPTAAESGDKLPSPAPVKMPDSVDLVMKLVEKSEIKNINDINYKNALGVFEYEVISDRKNNYPFDKI
ncbi:MAG: hypothetical protein AAF226_18735, partial [Verrucomicrobiota bacterium]